MDNSPEFGESGGERHCLRAPPGAMIFSSRRGSWPTGDHINGRRGSFGTFPCSAPFAQPAQDGPHRSGAAIALQDRLARGGALRQVELVPRPRRLVRHARGVGRGRLARSRRRRASAGRPAGSRPRWPRARSAGPPGQAARPSPRSPRRLPRRRRAAPRAPARALRGGSAAPQSPHRPPARRPPARSCRHRQRCAPHRPTRRRRAPHREPGPARTAPRPNAGCRRRRGSRPAHRRSRRSAPAAAGRRTSRRIGAWPQKAQPPSAKRPAK